MSSEEKIKVLLLETAALNYPKGTKFLNAFYKRPIPYDGDEEDDGDYEFEIHEITGFKFEFFNHESYPNGVLAIQGEGATGLVYFNGCWADHVDASGNIIKKYYTQEEVELQKAYDIIYED